MLTAADKGAVIQSMQRNPQDVGSSEVQIALLTARINDLQQHFKDNHKDNHSRRGLMRMVAKRHKLLKYLKRTNLSLYREVIAKLKLRG